MMKRTAIFTILAFLFFTGNAQVNIYRQNINQEIRKLVVSGSCFVHLQRDTSNWVSYQSTSLPESSQMVIIEGNVLTTTEAANGKILYVGTSAVKGSPFDIAVEDDAVVLFNGKYYTKSGVLTQDANVIKSSSPTHSWTGLKKYTSTQRLHWDFFFGACTWAVPEATFGSELYPTKFTKNTGIMGHTGFQAGYSIYMDNHIAAGIGVGYTMYNNEFKHPLVDYSTHDNLLFYGTSDLPGVWTTTTTTMSLGVPMHFIFYPDESKHSINMRLEVIPQISIIQIINQNYTYEQGGVSTNANYTRDLPFSLFNLTTRLSLNYGLLGAYAEIGLVPLSRNLSFLGNNISPHNFALGVRINLFDMIKK
jgi:hypothetical protein